MKFLRELAESTEVLTEATADGSKRMYIAGPFMMFDKANRNGRIYPQKVMDEAVTAYDKDYIKKSRALGEMSHPCFDETANVFVEGKGLIPIADVVAGDYVIGVDHKTNVSSRVKVLETTKNKYDGEMLTFNSRVFKATVTPYHRFYIKNRNGSFSVITADQIKKQVETGTREYSHSYIPVTVENWQSDVLEETIMFRQTIPRMSNPAHHYAAEPLELDYKKFCAFMGIYLSEGCLYYYNKVNGVDKTPSTICIFQNEGTAFDLIVDLVESMGFNKTAIKTRDGKAAIHISDIRMADYLAQFGDCYSKFIPDEILNTSKENILEFLHWFQLGDGSSHTMVQESKNGHVGEYTRNDVFTVSEKMADGLIECIIKAGHSTSKRIQLSKEKYMFADHEIDPANKSPLYRMTIGKSKGKYIDSRFIDVTSNNFDGYVYCLVTETSNFFVEQHGSVFLSGNCQRLSIDPERACIMTTDLQKDGNYYYGKAKVLSTPLGKLLENLLSDGVKIGVSSRGAGSVTQKGTTKYVQPGYIITAGADVVTDPSVAEAFVDHLMEEKEYILIGGQFVEQDLIEEKSRILKASATKLTEAKVAAFQRFMNKVSVKS